MSDIVERLREWSTCNVFPEQAQYVISEACLEITALRAEVERLRAALGDRCPVDAMDRGMTPVEAAVYHVWGERCPDFEPDCMTCRAWAELDRTAAIRALASGRTAS